MRPISPMPWGRGTKMPSVKELWGRLGGGGGRRVGWWRLKHALSAGSSSEEVVCMIIHY